MLEHRRKPPTDAAPVFLGVICQRAMLEEVKSSLKAQGCIIREEKPVLPPVEEQDWLTVEEVFPHFHAGDKIIGLRYREDMTQKRLAEKVGMSVQNLSHMEHGRRPIGKETAKKLAAALNCDYRVFL
jgi:DNA-binding XRE family transcriptional regulator